jgi:type IV secretion system protein VirD4
MHSDDVVYSLAVVLDTVGARLPKMAHAEIAAFLGQDDRSRNRVLARIRGRVSALGNSGVRAALRHSSFPLADLAAGEPYTVYLVIPAERMPVFAVLLRIWVGTLLHAMLRRRDGDDGGGRSPLLFLLDHCAALGSFPLLESVLRAGSPDGFRIWSFWHDVHELRATYPVTWPTLVSNSEAVQVFGTTDTAAAAEAEAVLGLAPNEVWSLAPGEQIVRLGAAAHRARKIDQRDVPAAASA